MNKKVNKKSNNIFLSYNNNIDNKFRAHLKLGENVIVIEEALIDENQFNHNGKMTYDDVEDVFYSILDEKYPISSFPKSVIEKIEILPHNEKVWLPVFAESMKKEIKNAKKSKIFNKFLVLPDATYSLTPEYKLWLQLIDANLIPTNADFDFNKLHKMIKNIKKNGKNR